MTNKKRAIHSHRESKRKRPTPVLSGPALESAIIAVLTKILRANPLRQETHEHTGQTDDAIEQVLLSPSLRRKVQTVIAAYVIEQTAAVVDLLFKAACAKQAWAFKIVFELTGLTDLMRTAIGQAPPEETDVIVSSEFERSLLESVRELLLCKDDTRAGGLGPQPAPERVEPITTET